MSENNSSGIAILIVVLVLVLLVFVFTKSCSKENYVAKTDIQYMKPNWEESWHTLTTDTAFKVGETLILNVDISISADVVKKDQIQCSIVFQSPFVFSQNNGIEKSDGPEGVWRSDNVGNAMFVFSVPVSKSSSDSEGKPVYTNVVHVQFKVFPNTIGKQQISIKFDKPLSAYNREFSFVVEKADDSELISSYEEKSNNYIESDLGFTINSSMNEGFFIGVDDEGSKVLIIYSPSIEKIFSSTDDIEIEYEVKKYDSFSGAIEKVKKAKINKCFVDESSSSIVVHESDLGSKFNSFAEKLFKSLRNGTRIDFEITEKNPISIETIKKIINGEKNKNTIISLDYSKQNIEQGIKKIKNLFQYRDLQL